MIEINKDHETLCVFVLLEHTELAEGYEITPYQPGVICSEWVELEIPEVSVLD
jgi:hypothetical protein